MGSPGSELSVELVQRIQAGDDSAWAVLYQRYRDPLLLSIRCRLSQALRARLSSEDVLQSVIKDALRDLQSFEHREEGALGHFLHVCVLNKIRNKADYHGALKRAGDVPLDEHMIAGLPAASLDDAPGYLESERFEKLERALVQLEEEVRELVLLRLVEGLSNVEAARALGKTPAATSKAYCRGLARLGTLTGDEGGP